MSTYRLGLLRAIFSLVTLLVALPGFADPPDTTPPKLLEFVSAPYPPSAQAAGVEGVVGLILSIDAAGLVTEVQVSEPAGFGFDEAAKEAAQKFRFEPAKQAGVAVPSQILYR